MLSAEVDGQGILVASSNDVVRQQLLRRLASDCFPTRPARGGADALMQLEEGHCGALVIDPRLDDLELQEVLSIVGERHPEVGVFVIDPRTGQAREAQPGVAVPPSLLRALGRNMGSPEIVEAWMRPQEAPGWHPEDSEAVAEDQPTAAAAAIEPPAGLPAQEQVAPLPGMIGSGRGLAQVYRWARLVARRETAVLITGETGTGKELVARAIHELSPRGKKPFVIVNCAAIPETLLEAEMFGYTRGAFTGAFQNHIGRFHTAHGGTLFLDEVGELPPSIQVKLLRFLQEGEVQRLGSSDLFCVDVRVLAATNADLLRRIAENTFRRDLYYRLAVFPIEIPPLRQRPEDIAPLAEHYAARLAEDGRPKRLSSGALGLLVEHSWPGNVRELHHVMERATILSDYEPVLLPRHFPTLEADARC